VGSLTAVQQLTLGDAYPGNFLSGSLPTQVGRLSSMQYFWIDNNRLSGTLPTQIGSLSALIQLWGYNNSFVGAMPPSLCGLVAGNLSDCELQANLFTCPLPTCATECAATCRQRPWMASS